jgi:transposase
VIVTRILQADVPAELAGICQVMGFVRADLWRRFGALRTVGKNANAIRAEITAGAYYDKLPVDGTVRAETTKDVVNDLLTYKAAAMLKVRQAIAKRTANVAERQRLYTLLRNEEWLSEPFLHRQMRKHFRHGKSHTANQFVVRSDKHSSAVVDGKLIVTLRLAKKGGGALQLTTTSSGKDVTLTRSNLRIIVKDGFTEIHYATEKAAGRASGVQVIGIDKGYTEAFTDSDGKAHGTAFGAVLTDYSDKTSETHKCRNKLHATEKKHRAAGRLAKADRIKKHNLGRKKIDARRDRAQRHLRTIAFQSAHTVVDKAGVVVSEDLSSPIAKKQPWKKFNRRMSSWAKGVLADALDSVCTQRNAKHVLVNGAYTSQMDSTTGLLQGKRVGDKFYRVNGDVLQADHNAALNVKARLDDRDILRFTPYKEVRRILLSRSPAQLSVKRLELGEPSRQPSADKS